MAQPHADSPERPVAHVSDTALWVAVYRAMESKRKDALFCDPYAERLAGDRGREIVGRLERGQSSAWSIITRTAVLDELTTVSIRSSIWPPAWTPAPIGCSSLRRSVGSKWTFPR